MKKCFVLAAMVALMVFVSAPVFSAEWENKIRQELKDSNLSTHNPNEVVQIGGVAGGSGFVSLKDEGDWVFITLKDPTLTPKGDTKGSGLKPAKKLQIASGILDANGKNPYFVSGIVNGDTFVIKIPNYAKKTGVPVVDHLWGVGEAADGSVGYLVHNPDDPFVSYQTKDGTYKTRSGELANLQTLAIGIVMYPDRPTASLKSLGKGKLLQGKHPEL
jgi:hypothetical protein